MFIQKPFLFIAILLLSLSLLSQNKKKEENPLSIGVGTTYNFGLGTNSIDIRADIPSCNMSMTPYYSRFKMGSQIKDEYFGLMLRYRVVNHKIFKFSLNAGAEINRYSNKTNKEQIQTSGSALGYPGAGMEINMGRAKLYTDYIHDFVSGDSRIQTGVGYNFISDKDLKKKKKKHAKKKKKKSSFSKRMKAFRLDQTR